MSGLALVAAMVLAFLLIPAAPAAADSPRLGEKVVVLVIDRVSAAELPGNSTPFLSRLAGRWSFGLMVTRTGERETGKEQDLGGGYATIGAGVRARGARQAGLSFDSTETPEAFGGALAAGEIYEKATGITAPRDGVVCLGFQQVRANSKRVGAEEKVGLLGTALGDSGLIAAVAGNRDSLGGADRMAPLVCCDETGAVPLGDVGSDNAVFAPGSPGGFRTDYGALLDNCRRLLAASDLLVIDTGETGRIDQEYGNIDQGVLERERAYALRRADRFARRVASMLDLESSLLLVVSPVAPTEAREEGNYLTPLIAAGGGFGRGVLTSDSTRRPGLVNNVDLLPTALDRFGISVPPGVSGSVMRSTGGPADGVAGLRELSAQLPVTMKARWPIMVTYVITALVFMFAAAMIVHRSVRRAASPPGGLRGARFVRVGAVVMLATPLSLLVVSAFRYDGYAFPAVFCACFTVVVGGGAWLLQRRSERMDPVVSLCLLTAALMVVDLAFGGTFFLLPLLGVSALEGMRLYGLSNAMAGLLIATSLWGITGLAGDRALERGAARWAVLAALLGVSFAVGFGALGANVGSFIAALATTLTFFAATSGKRFTALRAGGVALGTAAATAALILLDSVLLGTHAGKVVGGGAEGFIDLAQRKLAIQLGQISFYLLPAIVLIAAVVAMALWMGRPGSYWRRRAGAHRLQNATLFSLVIGGLVALVFNDTGVVMLGVMTGVTGLAMSYYMLGEISG